MAIRPIIEVPDPLLRTISEPVTRFDADLRILVEDMFDTMYAAPGIGLAAIQVGVPLRLVVMDLGDDPEPSGDDPHAKSETGTDSGETGRLEEPFVDADAVKEGAASEDRADMAEGASVRRPRVFVNPEILDPSADWSVYREGCLSVPEQFAEVERPAACRARWQDLDGVWHEEAMTGLLATCFQHEMDHLQGVVFLDHLSRLKRDMIMKKLTKTRRAA